MKVPFLAVKSGYEELRDEFDAAYHRVMDSGSYLLGKELEQFECEFAAYCQAEYCVGLGNGLEDLHRSKSLRYRRRRRSDCSQQYVHCHMARGFLRRRHADPG